MEKRFSIIIPIYKVEKYLKECIESVLNQTYGNFEVILIDDGSPDNCGKICDEYAKKDCRIIVIHKKNGGLSDARNAGINVAKGEYCIFLDSDDYWCKKEALAKINEKINKSNLDVLVFGYKKEYEDSKKATEKNKLEINNKNNLIENMIEKNYFKACAWDKVIKRKLIIDNDMKFPENLYSEDISWCAELIKYSKTFDILNENIYVYRQRNTSITKNIKEKNINDMINQISKYYNDSEEYILNSYLAYEYSVVLGLISCKAVKGKCNQCLQTRIYKMKNILNYNLSRKVNKVNKVNKILGIRGISKLLGIFINLKGC